MAMSLVIPILIGFLPELLGRAIEYLLRTNNNYASLLSSITAPPAAPGDLRDGQILLLKNALADILKSIDPQNLTLYVSVRFLIAYLITIVTLELALQAQAIQSGKRNPWLGLLLTNLGFDIVSVVVFQIFQVVTDKLVADNSVTIFFFICAIPTILTGVIVVSGSYAALTGDQ
jgi:hypothetical protein